ncbi:MAG TPA: YtxH domain-containing protein [Desulfuromonadales bacterium]|nr:YtxH domain-containing protein [Desulfuromonadales bacterium]
MPENTRQTFAGALLLIAGGAIGAGLGILYAPKSGKRTRREVVRYGRKLRNETEKKAHQATESVSDFVDDLGEQTGHLVKRGGEVTDDLRKELLRSMDSAQKSLDEQRKKLKRL